MSRLPRTLPALLLSAVLVLPASAFDWGGSVDSTTTTVVNPEKPELGSLGQGLNLKGWASWSFGRSTGLLVKASLSDAFKLGLDAKHTVTNTLTPNLDYLVFSTPDFWAGRNDLRDFGGTVLNTRLDGLRWKGTLPWADLTLALGTTALQLRSASTVVIGQGDLNDRSVTADWTKPETLFAGPRLIGYAEAETAKLIPGITLQAAEILQLDLRSSQVGKDGGKVDPNAPDTAPVTMTYTGLGASGRLGGPLYWSASTYLGLGTTLTSVGTYKAGQSVPTPVDPVYPTWKTALVANLLAAADLTLLMPEWSHSIVNLSLQAGSWDQDGTFPYNNAADGDKPTLFTGFFGVSRTGAALIFNPQPANMATVQLLWSVKPLAGTKGLAESLQLVTTLSTFVRPTVHAITEAGLKPASQDLYLASEADLSLAWRPASDWGANLGVGLLLPNKLALDRGLELKAQAGLNLSF